MKKQTYEIGNYVEKFCVTCNEQLAHIVKSLTKTGAVSRVGCPKCGQSGTYKASVRAKNIQDLANKTGSPYSQSTTYRTGQVMAHPVFGTGEVMTVFGTKTIDVLFTDRVRRLVHSR